MNWGVSAAVHAALETPVPAQAEAETYPRSAIEEALPEQVESFDAFLPRRRLPLIGKPQAVTAPAGLPAPVHNSAFLPGRMWPRPDCWSGNVTNSSTYRILSGWSWPRPESAHSLAAQAGCGKHWGDQ